MAFLGAGVSAPLYPLWTGLIGDLVDAAAGRMSEEEAASGSRPATNCPGRNWTRCVPTLLDQAEHADHGWAAKADALHARLVPSGLDPDPLATVDRQVAAQKRRRRGESES